ncbi:MAG TPA: hypothetical protein VK138_02245 [Acidiferrobacterales bacterium]|nr:hypothetical protein [Acidiferrobacterales bacterium]
MTLEAHQEKYRQFTTRHKLPVGITDERQISLWGTHRRGKAGDRCVWHIDQNNRRLRIQNISRCIPPRFAAASLKHYIVDFL